MIRARRARRTRDEWRQLVAEWRASGLTAAAFTAERGLSVHSLLGWSSRLGREDRFGLSASFVAVEVQERPQRAPTDRPIATVNAGNVALHIDQSASPEWVAALLRELRYC